MSKASREIIKHYKKKCARKKSIKFRQVRVNEIEMISLAFYYSRARQQTKKRQLIDHQLSFSFSCAQDKTRTCTNVIVHYPLKVARLPIPPPLQLYFQQFKEPTALPWCPEQDSNLHASRHTHLKRARLPIPPPGHR